VRYAPDDSSSRSERRHLDGSDLPNLIRIDAVIVVCENDPETSDVLPLHGWTSGLCLVSQAACGLADDLQQPLDGEAHGNVSIELGSPARHEISDLTGGLRDVGDPLVVASGHRLRASALIR
jgi:hypothetical protein